MERLTIQAWDPSFGSEAAFETEQQDLSQRSVDTEVEFQLSDWKPIRADTAPIEPIAFLDGVRRIDARGLLESENQVPAPALFVSLACGICRCDGASARVGDVSVRRLLLCAEKLDSFQTGAGTYQFERVPSPGTSGLLNGLRQSLRELEREMASAFQERCLILADGPLSTSSGNDSVIGYIKSHHTRYLTGVAEETLGLLLPGERTPLFLIESPWPRYSFYLRLPALKQSGLWSSLCRLEIAGGCPRENAIQLADRMAAQLPRFASQEYREPRAPQNLYPISGLEQALRVRLGDSELVLRSIRQA